MACVASTTPMLGCCGGTVNPCPAGLIPWPDGTGAHSYIFNVVEQQFLVPFGFGNICFNSVFSPAIAHGLWHYEYSVTGTSKLFSGLTLGAFTSIEIGEIHPGCFSSLENPPLVPNTPIEITLISHGASGNFSLRGSCGPRLFSLNAGGQILAGPYDAIHRLELTWTGPNPP